jgi:nicotinamidase-related amidase
MYTLCVIDMQNYFPAARYQNVIDNIKLEIIKAKKRNYPVLYVKYNLAPWTSRKWDQSLSPGLSDITRFYRKKYTVIKDHDDGGNDVYNFLSKNNLPKKLRVCGVNSGICVMYTVDTLSKKYNLKIDIVENAIASDYALNDNDALDRFNKMKNVKVI